MALALPTIDAGKGEFLATSEEVIDRLLMIAMYGMLHGLAIGMCRSVVPTRAT